MEITIQSVNFETSVSLNEYINKRLAKLNKFIEISNAEVQLKVLTTSDKANKEIGIKIKAGTEEFYACKVAEIYEDAVAQTIEALEHQIEKAKDKR